MGTRRCSCFLHTALASGVGFRFLKPSLWFCYWRWPFDPRDRGWGSRLACSVRWERFRLTLRFALGSFLRGQLRNRFSDVGGLAFACWAVSLPGLLGDEIRSRILKDTTSFGIVERVEIADESALRDQAFRGFAETFLDAHRGRFRWSLSLEPILSKLPTACRTTRLTRASPTCR